MTALLEVTELKKHFPIRGGFFGGTTGYVYAVDGISFHIEKGETLALVGESGCGKSTVGKAILRLFDITSGQVVLDGQRIDDMSPGTLRPLRRRVQVWALRRWTTCWVLPRPTRRASVPVRSPRN